MAGDYNFQAGDKVLVSSSISSIDAETGRVQVSLIPGVTITMSKNVLIPANRILELEGQVAVVAKQAAALQNERDYALTEWHKCAQFADKCHALLDETAKACSVTKSFVEKTEQARQGGPPTAWLGEKS